MLKFNIFRKKSVFLDHFQFEVSQIRGVLNFSGVSSHAISICGSRLPFSGNSWLQGALKIYPGMYEGIGPFIKTSTACQVRTPTFVVVVIKIFFYFFFILAS